MATKKIDNNYAVDTTGIVTADGYIDTVLLNNQRSGYIVCHAPEAENKIGYNSAMTLSSNKITNMGLNSKTSATSFLTFSSSDSSVGYSSILNTDGTNLTSTLALLNSSGTALLPAYSFTGDSNTGIYRVGADQLGITTNGTLRFDIGTTAITSTLPIYNSSGTEGAPSYTFSTDPDTGLYLIGNNNLGISTAGTIKLEFSNTFIIASLPFYVSDGSATSPTISFTTDSNTGFYKISNDSIGITTGGALRMSIASALTTIANHVTYSNRVYLNVRSSVTQSVNNSTFTLLTFNTTDLSEGSGFTWASNLFTNTSGYTKYYMVKIHTLFNGANTTSNFHYLYINGAQNNNYYTTYPFPRTNTAFCVRLANNDTMDVRVYYTQAPGPYSYGANGSSGDNSRLVIMEMS